MALDEILILGFLALLAFASIWIVVGLFRSGSRDRFITWRPFTRIALYTLGISILNIGARWAMDVPMHVPPIVRLAGAAILFAVCATIWLAGFFYGRRRRERRFGVLSRSR